MKPSGRALISKREPTSHSTINIPGRSRNSYRQNDESFVGQYPTGVSVFLRQRFLGNKKPREGETRGHLSTLSFPCYQPEYVSVVVPVESTVHVAAQAPFIDEVPLSTHVVAEAEVNE